MTRTAGDGLCGPAGAPAGALSGALYVRVERGGLIESLQEHAQSQGVSVDLLVETTLEKCVELDLLRGVMSPQPFDKSAWGQA